MPFTTLSLGLTLTIPTNGTTNWGTTVFNTTWTKISQHAHTGSGDGSLIGTSALVANSITTVKLAKNLGYTVQSTLTPSGTAQTIDWDSGMIVPLNLGSATGDVTLTLSNPIAGAWYEIHVTQGATPRDLIWPAGVTWPQGIKPILSTGNGDIDKIWLRYDGTNYLGDWDLNYT